MARGAPAAKAAASGAGCDAPWTKEVEVVAADLGVDVHVGLSADEVARRQQQYGFNELEKEPGEF
jgi:hypothetical protein